MRQWMAIAALLASAAGCDEHDLGKPCGTCANGVKDGEEADVDCGGWCLGCAEGRACAADFDCASGACDETRGICEPPPPGARATTRESVGQSTNYPCESLICINTGGKPGYCSQKCRNNAGCPEGFVCRTVLDTGPFAHDKFCAWKSCATRADCGTVDEFCCRKVEGVDPVEEVNACEFANDEGKCG